MDREWYNMSKDKKIKGGVTMNNKKLRSLDLNKIRNKKSIIVSSKEALKDVTPVKWDEEVLSGKEKITLSKAN